MSLIYVVPYYANGTNVAPVVVVPPPVSTIMYSNTGDTVDTFLYNSGLTTNGQELELTASDYARIVVGATKDYTIEYEAFLQSGKTTELGLVVGMDGASDNYLRMTPSYGCGFGGPLTSWNYTGGQGGIGGALSGFADSWVHVKVEVDETELRAYFNGNTGAPDRTVSVSAASLEHQLVVLIASPALGTGKIRNLNIYHNDGVGRFAVENTTPSSFNRPSDAVINTAANAVQTKAGGWTSMRPDGTGKTSGKWFYEATLISETAINTGYSIIGIDAGETDYSSPTYPNSGSNALVMAGTNVFNTLVGVTNTTSSGYADGDLLAFVVDLDAVPQTCSFYKNEVLEWTQELPSGKTWYPTFGHFVSGPIWAIQTRNASTLYGNASLWA